MYKTTTYPLNERKKLIDEGVSASTDKYSFYEYKNRQTDLPVVRLSINVPIYRMQNYRTRTEQRKYIQEHEKDSNFFIEGQENDSAQQAQHEILVSFAKKGRAESVVPIMDELCTEEQREPLLISANGVVVNGNRRLAAMRELSIQEPQNFRHFGYVDCAVLPDNVTPEEMQEIEVRLQMQPETKLPYGWVNESLAIRDLVESGKKLEYVADLMKKKKNDVQRAYSALYEADFYLEEWVGKSGEYQYVEDSEQVFKDLAKALEGKSQEESDASRRIAWALVSNSKNLRRRVYDYNFSFGKRADEVITGLADRLDIDLTNDQGSASGEVGDEFGIDIEPADETSLEPLIKAFHDQSRRSEVTNELIAVCDGIIEKDRQGAIGRRALTVINEANSKLQEVDLTRADADTYDKISAQLESIMNRAQNLYSNLQSYINGNS